MSELFASAGRSVLFLVLIGLVYFAVVETVVGGPRPGWQQWLVASNAVALITQGGLPIYPDEALFDDQGVHSTGH